MFAVIIQIFGILTILIRTLEATYIITSNGENPRRVAASIDDAKTWIVSPPLIKDFSLQAGYCVSQTTCYLIANHIGRAYQVLKTENSGKTWINIKTSKVPGETIRYGIADMGLYCKSEKECIFGLFDSVVHTKDAFQTHTEVLRIKKDKQLKTARVTGIQCVKNNTVCLLTMQQGYSGAIYRSLDGGRSWIKQYSSYIELFGLSCISTPAKASFCMAVGKTGIFFVSTDHGNSWSSMSYKMEGNYFSPTCPISTYPRRCSMAKKVSTVQCLAPYHCVVGFRGYQTGSGVSRYRQNGALCSVKKHANEKAKVKCLKTTTYNTNIKLHCSSPSQCFAVKVDRFTRTNKNFQKYFVYDTKLYKYTASTNRWKMNDNLPTMKFSSVQNVFGTAFSYDKNFDFTAGGGGAYKENLGGGDGDSNGSVPMLSRSHVLIPFLCLLISLLL